MRREPIPGPMRGRMADLWPGQGHTIGPLWSGHQGHTLNLLLYPMLRGNPSTVPAGTRFGLRVNRTPGTWSGRGANRAPRLEGAGRHWEGGKLGLPGIKA